MIDDFKIMLSISKLDGVTPDNLLYRTLEMIFDGICENKYYIVSYNSGTEIYIYRLCEKEIFINYDISRTINLCFPCVQSGSDIVYMLRIYLQYKLNRLLNIYSQDYDLEIIKRKENLKIITR
jgi:hypothetical protein